MADLNKENNVNNIENSENTNKKEFNKDLKVALGVGAIIAVAGAAIAGIISTGEIEEDEMFIHPIIEEFNPSDEQIVCDYGVPSDFTGFR